MLIKLVDAKNDRQRHILNVVDVQGLGPYVDPRKSVDDHLGLELVQGTNEGTYLVKSNVEFFPQVRAYEGGYVYLITVESGGSKMLCVNIDGPAPCGVWLMNDDGHTIDKLPRRLGLPSDA